MNKLIYNKIKLPLAELHYAECGSGLPLIILPATVSRIDNWENLILFMSQKYRVFFFELPGHGKSSPFKSKYNSDLVAETVKDFIEYFKFDKVSILGFSFGGILALKTYEKISSKIERVILFSPCLTKNSLHFGFFRKLFIRFFISLMKSNLIGRMMIYILKFDLLISMVIKIIESINRTTFPENFHENLKAINLKTLEILAFQLEEILTTSINIPENKYETPCIFGMSIHDPMINFNSTKEHIHKLFSNISEVLSYNHFHQPPKPYTVKEYHNSYSEILNSVSA